MPGTVLIGHTCGFKRCVKTSIEIHRNRSPLLIFLHILGFCNHITLYSLRINNLYSCIAYGTTFALPVTDIQQDMAVFTCREGVSLVSDTGCGREFCPDAIILQNHTIIAGIGNFVRLLEGTSPTFFRILKQARLCLGLAGNGHQCDTTHLELVQTGETVYAGMSIFVSDSLPTILVSVCSVGTGSEFCQSKWFGSGSIDKPSAMHRSQIRIHIIQNIFLLPVA